MSDEEPVRHSGQFDSAKAKALAAEVADRKRKEAEEARAEFLKRTRLADLMVKELPRSKLGAILLAGAQRVAVEVLIGNVPIRNASDAAAAINSMVTAGRLELGESTKNVEVTDSEERRERIKELQIAAQKQLEQTKGEVNSLTLVPKDGTEG